MKQVNDLLKAKKFDAIEQIASEATANKERSKGAYWKIDSVYDGLVKGFPASTAPEDQEITEQMWLRRIQLLKEWKDKKPDSIFPRIALGEAYREYGWLAHVFNDANNVSEENRVKLNERMDLARNELAEANSLGPQCPAYYRSALKLALVNGRPRQEFDEIYQAAVKYEPGYSMNYLARSEFLEPKWGGSTDQWQKFIENLPCELAELGVEDADIIYFIVVANKANESTLHANWSRIPKERFKKGFADLENKYGSDNFRLNQYAHLLCKIVDLTSANAIFARIGKNYHPDVWDEREYLTMKRFSRKGLEAALNPQLQVKERAANAN